MAVGTGYRRGAAKGERSAGTGKPSLGVGDGVIRRREPRGRYDETPLLGEIVRVRGDRATVRWAEAVRYKGRERGDNHSTVRLSELLPATEENVRKAESRLKGRKAKAWIDRAEFYEEMADVRERQDLPAAAKWMRREAADARARAEKSGVA